MIVKQIYTQCLAQASYYIESDGESVVIDPIRDIDSYVNLLDINNSKLKFILETHFHSDFISGHIEVNKKYADLWPNISEKKDHPADHKQYKDVKDKYEKYFKENLE